MTFVHLNVLIPFQAYGECSTGHYDQTFVFNKVSKLGDGTLDESVLRGGCCWRRFVHHLQGPNCRIKSEILSSVTGHTTLAPLVCLQERLVHLAQEA